MDNDLVLKLILDMSTQGVSVSGIAKEFDSLANAQQKQGDIAKNTALAESMALADRMKLKTQQKSLAMDELKTDEQLLASKAKLSKSNTDIQKSVKELTKEMLYEEKVTRAMADANAYVEKTFAGVAKGALSLSDAEAKLTQNAKAVAQEIMTLKKEIEASGKATAEQTAKLKQLETALDTYKEAADEAGDAQLEFNRLMQNSDERLSGNVKAIGMMTGALSGLGGTMGSIFGDGAAKMADFAGSAATAANQFGGMIDQMKAGKDMKGFQGGMMQATAAIGMFQAGLQIAMQVWDMFDGAIKKGEQTIIDAGKNATQTANQFKSYELGNKTLDDRIKLIDQVAEKDQKMASSLRGLAADSEAFDLKLKQVNATLLKTREAGAGMEWKTGQTGGGLLGWIKSAGTAINEMSANMGKAIVAIDEFRSNVSLTGKDMETAMNAASSYTGSVTSRINQMNIAIATNRGDIAEARRLELEGLNAELIETKKLIQEKIKLTKQRQIEASVQAATVRKAVSDQQAIINNLKTFRRDDASQSIINSVFGNDKDLTAFMLKFRGIIDNNVKYYSDESTYLKETVAELSNVFGKQFRAAVNAQDLTVKQFFTNLVDGDADIKNYVASMRTLLPALEEVGNGTKLYEQAIKDLNNQLDPKKAESIEAAYAKLIAKQQELWASEDAKNKKEDKPKSIALDKFAMPQLQNVDKEVDYWLTTLAKKYETWGNKFNFQFDPNVAKKAFADRTRELATYIEKDNTLQDAIKAQQTKIADLEKALPKLTGAERTRAEQQIKTARDSIVSLTSDLNAALEQTAHLRADILLSAKAVIDDVSNIDSMTALKTQTKTWQQEIDKIKKGYDNLSDAGKLAADTQIASINSVIIVLDEQVATLSAAVRTAVNEAKKVNDDLEKSYKAAQSAWDAVHDHRTQAQKDEDAFQKKLADTTKYYDDQIKAFHDKGIFGTSDIKALEDMRDSAVELINDTHDLETATKAYNDQLKAAADLLKKVQDGANVAAKIHEEWFKKINPIQYEKDAVQATIDSMEITKKALLDAATSGDFSADLTAVLYKMGFDANQLTGDIKKDTDLITKYFQQISDEAWKNAGFIQDAQGVWRKLGVEVDETGKAIAKATQGLTSFNKELEDLKTKNASFKLDINVDEFVKSFDDALTGRQDSVLKKIQDSNKKALDALDETSNKSKQAVYSWWEAYQKEGLEKGFDSKAMLDKYGMNYSQMWELYSQKILDIDNQTAQKRLDIAQKNALDLAAAYKTEFDKLTQMQKSLDDMIASHDQKTADARTEVAKYVTRQKLKEGDRQIYDQAQQLGEEYEKYRKAGMSEQDLAEWLALRKSELTKGENKDQLNQFDKFWKDRKALADKAADADKEAFDNQVNAAKNAINTQKELVDALKTSADAARDAVIEMLRQIAEAAGVTVPNPAAGQGDSSGANTGNITGTATRTTMDGRPISPTGVPQPPRSEWPSGAIDCVWVGDPQNQWQYRYPNNAGKTETQPNNSAAATPTVKGYPLETSAEIQARIDNMNKLQETFNKVMPAIQKMITDMDTALQESFKLLQPDMTDQWVKDLINKIGVLSTALVKAFKEPFVKEFDPLNGTGLIKIIAEWGHTLIQNYGIGIESGINNLKESILKTLAAALTPYLETHSPPKEGPLHFIDKWGYETGTIYTTTLGQGITDGNYKVYTSLEDTANTVKTASKKMNYQYSPQNLGMATMVGTTDLTALKGVFSKLTEDPVNAGMWKARVAQYNTEDKEFGAYSAGLSLQANRASIDKQNADLNLSSIDEKVDSFWEQWNKGGINPDLGDLNESLTRQMIADHPQIKNWWEFKEKLKQQYPDIYNKLIADGTLVPVAATDINDPLTGERIGKKETGNVYDKYSWDYQENNYKGATGFNDWLQAKINAWYKQNENMADPTTGKTIGYGTYDVVTARDKFFQGYDKQRLADIMDEYNNYVKGLGTVKSSTQLEQDILSKYQDTEIAKAIQAGTLDKTLVDNKYSNALLTDTLKKDFQDKIVQTGGAFYDKSGNEVADSSILSGGGSPTSQEAWAKLIGSKINSPIGDQDPAIMKFRAGVAKAFGGEGWSWGWFRDGEGTPVQLPYAVIKTTDAAQLRQDGFDISPMSEQDVERIFGHDAVKRFKEQGVWPFVLLSADKAGNNEVGNYSDIEKSVNDAMAKLREENAKLADAMESRGTTNPTEGDTLGDLTYKNKYTTVKGNYSAGISYLNNMAGGLTDDRRKAILDIMAAQIDKAYPDVTQAINGGNVGGEISGDSVPISGSQTYDYSAVRAAAKDQLSQALGFSKEYSVVRGWRNADGANVDSTANEEILKWIEATGQEIKKLMPTVDQGMVESQNVADTRAVLKDLVKDGINQDTLTQFQYALNMALQMGYVTKDEAASLVTEVLPDTAKFGEQLGLTSYRGGMDTIGDFNMADAILRSPWGSEYNTSQGGQEGFRQFLGEYTDVHTMADNYQYANKQFISDNAFKYYAQSTPSPWYNEGTPWLNPPSAGVVSPSLAMPGMPSGFGAPTPNFGTGNRISTFSSGTGNTFYFAVTIAKMDVADGTDFGDQFIDAITDKMKSIGVTI